jgi:hypothetical protein
MAERHWCKTPSGLRLTLCIEPGGDSSAREMLVRFFGDTLHLLRPLAGGVLSPHVTRVDVPGTCRWTLSVPLPVGIDQVIADLEAMLSRARMWQSMQIDARYFFAAIHRITYGQTIRQSLKILRRRGRRNDRAAVA